MWIRYFLLCFWKRSGIYHVGVSKLRIANLELRTFYTDDARKEVVNITLV